jgi:hypothetical protein
MNRILVAMMMAAGCGGGSSNGNSCRHDSDCRRGEICDADGSCVSLGGDSANGGGSGGSFGFGFGSSGGGSSAGGGGASQSGGQNRAALPCTTNSECPGGHCAYGGNEFVVTGYCQNECGKSGAPNQALCRQGTICAESPGYAPECVQFCVSSSDCGQGLRCEAIAEGPYAGRGYCREIQLHSAGGSCAKNADCLRGEMCDTGVSGGYCTASCLSMACPTTVDVCVAFDDSHHLCMGYCSDPGKQSTCPAGQTCRALQGKTSGFCL